MTTKFDRMVNEDSNETNQTGNGDAFKSRSCDKIKSLYLYYHKTYANQT